LGLFLFLLLFISRLSINRTVIMDFFDDFFEERFRFNLFIFFNNRDLNSDTNDFFKIGPENPFFYFRFSEFIPGFITVTGVREY
jgi:hypothetical protein